MFSKNVKTVLATVVFVASSLVSADHGRSFNSGGVDIHFVDQGAGTAVILLHGFNGDYESSLQWTGNALSEHYRVIALDQRGHGRSGKPHDDEAYGRHFASDVLVLMDELNIAKAHVVGHSMGGIVAMYLAANRPERFYSAVTIGNGLLTKTELNLIGWMLRGRFAWAQLKTFLGFSEDISTPEKDSQALALVAGQLHELVVTEQQAASLEIPVLAMRGGDKDDPADTVERLVAINPAIAMLRIEAEDHVTIVSSQPYIHRLQSFLMANDRVDDSHR